MASSNNIPIGSTQDRELTWGRPRQGQRRTRGRWCGSDAVSASRSAVSPVRIGCTRGSATATRWAPTTSVVCERARMLPTQSPERHHGWTTTVSRYRARRACRTRRSHRSLVTVTRATSPSPGTAVSAEDIRGRAPHPGVYWACASPRCTSAQRNLDRWCRTGACAVCRLPGCLACLARLCQR